MSIMNNFVLNNIEDVRSFCLLKLGYISDDFLKTDYIPITIRDFIWKILKANMIIELVHVDAKKCTRYMENIKSPTYPISSRKEVWEYMIPIYKALREYASTHFKPSEVYIHMSDNGYIKHNIVQALKNSGVHSWTAYISPITERFWVEGDIEFFEFLERIEKEDLNIPGEWWDFHRSPRPNIVDE